MRDLMKATIVRRVDFCDVDLTGVMWHGNYCKYYEDARCNLLKKLGFSYQIISDNGFQIPLVSLKMKYIKSCFFDQEIAITAKLVEARHLLIIKYEMAANVSGEKLSTAESRHMVFHTASGKAVLGMPDFIRKELEKLHLA